MSLEYEPSSEPLPMNLRQRLGYLLDFALLAGFVFRVESSGFGVEGLKCRVEGSG